jgi:hypothetical protein
MLPGPPRPQIDDERKLKNQLSIECGSPGMDSNHRPDGKQPLSFLFHGVDARIQDSSDLICPDLPKVL